MTDDATPFVLDRRRKSPAPPRASFADDFRRFFARGLSTVLPTLITLWVVVWAWNFLWNAVGTYVIAAVRHVAWAAGYDQPGPVQARPWWMEWAWHPSNFSTRLIGVAVAVLIVYLIGVFVGNLIGSAAWRMAEMAVMRLPLVRAIYPAVKQITDFLLADRGRTAAADGQFSGSRVVAVRPHEDSIWSIGLVTGNDPRALSAAIGEEMVTVFVPSSPTAFSGYVLVVPRARLVELPLTVEEALRLLVSGGVVMPSATPATATTARIPVPA